MVINNTFSLSLQKQISKQNIVVDSDINKAFNELRLKSLLNRSGIRKAREVSNRYSAFPYCSVTIFKKNPYYSRIPNRCFTWAKNRAIHLMLLLPATAW